MSVHHEGMTTTSGRPADDTLHPVVPPAEPSPAPARPVVMSPLRRGLQLVIGLLVFGASMAMMLHADQGAMPWSVLDQGIVGSTGLAYGWVVLGISAIVMLAWIPLRQKPGIGTIANIVLLSLVIDPALWVLDRLLPDPALGMSIGLALGGIVLNGVGTAAYVGARLGPGPRDGLMTGAVRLTGWPVWLVKTAIEVAVVVVGVLLGGTFGWATVAFAFCVGPVVHVGKSVV